MDYIEELLQTEAGAQSLKDHLKAVPKHEKAKPQFQRLWKQVCIEVNKHKLLKAAKLKEQQRLKEYEALVKSAKISKPKYLLQTAKLRKKTRNALLLLTELYPKIFDYDNPKPLKIDIFEDIEHCGKIDSNLLRDALTYYTRSEQYCYSFITDAHRYDLSGNAVSTITEEEKVWAVELLYQAVGRLKIKQDYPALINLNIIQTPEIVAAEDYGHNYYSSVLLEEILAILLDCFGKSVCVVEKSSRNSMRFVSIVQVMQQDGILFETLAENEGAKKAQRLALVKLLVKLQNDIEAYPFEYDKCALSEAEIEKGFLRYYKAK